MPGPESLLATCKKLLNTLLFVGLLATAGCREETVHQAEFYVFGTLVDVKVRGTDNDTAAAAFADLQRRFQQMHRDLHAWEPGLLSDVNSAFEEGRDATANEELVTLVRASQQLEESSAGHFNAAAGGLVGLWGFHTSQFPVMGPPPGADEIGDWLQADVSTRDIHIDRLVLRSDNPRVRLDFGGIAKGHAVDVAMQALDARGLHAALVNAGGDLRARGWSGGSWKIGILDPAGGVLGALEITGDEAVFTSGTGQRFRQDGNRRWPHVLNPHTGYPVEGLQSVTVIAREGITADAAATALLVAGPDDWPQVARGMGIEAVLVVDDAGDIALTPAMQARVSLSERLDRQVALIEP